MAAGDFFKKLRGTLSPIFQFGKGGPNIKNNSGVLEARNAADAALAVVRAADPVGSTDLVTKQWGLANLVGAAGGGLTPYKLLATGETFIVPANRTFFFSRRFTMQGTALLIIHGGMEDMHAGASFTKT